MPKRALPFIFTIAASLVALPHLSSKFTPSPAYAQSTTTINPTPINDFMTNPGMGWQDMPPSDNLFPETVAYGPRRQTSWKFLNTSDGVYDWSALDTRLNQAISEGKQYSMNVYTMRGEGFGGHQIPQWVMDKGVQTRSGDEGGIEPYYSDCIYQEEWGKFVEAYRQRYDGNSDIAYFDITGYGNFNEWSWQDTQTVWEDDYLNPVSLDGYARKVLADIFIGGSNSAHQCRNSDGSTRTSVSYSYPGFQTSQLVMPYAGIRQTLWYVFGKRSDIGFRYNGLGNRNDGYIDMIDKIGSYIQGRWPTAPVVFEVNYVDWPNSTYVQRIENLLYYSHGSFIHDNPDDVPYNGEIDYLMRDVGYRYVLQQASYPSQVAQGGPLQLDLNWHNVGLAPSYPKMGQTFQVHFYLTDPSGSVVADLPVSADVFSWMPAEPFPGTPPDNLVTQSLTIPPTVSPGTYNTKIAIMDTRTGLPINLAIAGKDAQGRYDLGTITVTGTSPTYCPEDIDEDSMVDLTDYSLLVTDFFETQSSAAYPRADINQDDLVDLTDYSLLVAKFDPLNPCTP